MDARRGRRAARRWSPRFLTARQSRERRRRRRRVEGVLGEESLQKRRRFGRRRRSRRGFLFFFVVVFIHRLFGALLRLGAVQHVLQNHRARRRIQHDERRGAAHRSHPRPFVQRERKAQRDGLTRRRLLVALDGRHVSIDVENLPVRSSSRLEQRRRVLGNDDLFTRRVPADARDNGRRPRGVNLGEERRRPGRDDFRFRASVPTEHVPGRARDFDEHGQGVDKLERRARDQLRAHQTLVAVHRERTRVWTRGAETVLSLGRTQRRVHRDVVVSREHLLKVDVRAPVVRARFARARRRSQRSTLAQWTQKRRPVVERVVRRSVDVDGKRAVEVFVRRTRAPLHFTRATQRNRKPHALGRWNRSEHRRRRRHASLKTHENRALGPVQDAHVRAKE